MTETEWLKCEIPTKMLEWLLEGREAQYGAWRPSTASDRKLRLYACACCLAQGTALEVVEGYEKDGMSSECGTEYSDEGWARGWTEFGRNKPTFAERASLLRDIFGNPWCPVEKYDWDQNITRKPDTSFNVRWLTWNGKTIPNLAQEIYQSRDFTMMPILGDMLEEADCTNENILRHCRGWKVCSQCDGTGAKWKSLGKEISPCTYCSRTSGFGWEQSFDPHVRGCWVLDLLLAKE